VDNHWTTQKGFFVSVQTDSIDQKQGVINKCPNCGGVLKAFTTTCEFCGHELAGVRANRTISALVAKFDELESEAVRSGLSGSALEGEIVARKARIIRDFPIPNSREDLLSLLYFIHPKIQNCLKPDPNADDWRIKFREVMSLAKNAYKGDAKTRAEFEEMERSLNTTLSSSLQTQAKRRPLTAIIVIVVVLLSAIGIASTQIEKWNLKECHARYERGAEAEKGRLEKILTKSDVQFRSKLFSESLATLNQLRWEYQESCMPDAIKKSSEQWEAKRNDMTALVQRAEAENVAQKQAAEEKAAGEKRAAENKLESDLKTAEAAKNAATKAQADKAAAAAQAHAAREATKTREASHEKDW
jgi:hypothetical protein